MSTTKHAADRQKILAKNNASDSSPGEPLPCISQNLFEHPPQSHFFLFQIFYNLGHLYLTYMSKFVFGQFLLSSFDYYVTKLEKTLDFCVPREFDDVNHNKIPKGNKHPMIWFLFLPALIGLRLFFFYASVFSIILGNGEVTAREMQFKVNEFRRYYRSVRYFAVKPLTKEALKEREEKSKVSFIWRLIYSIDESIFMRNPPMVCEDDNHENHIAPEDKTDNRLRFRKSRNVKKNCLNEIDGDSSDEGLNTNEKLDKYANLKDSPSVDPDYVPGDESSSEDTSSDGELDTEEEKTESQRKLNGDHSEPHTSSGPTNGFSSDGDAREKSKNETGLSLDKEQLAELESQLVAKIMKHFKTTYNYAPATGGSGSLDDVFYSPIGSPPEKGYLSDPDHSTMNNSSESTNVEAQEVTQNEENNPV